MFCIKCGAELSDGQTACPLCATKVYHPDLPFREKSTYPRGDFPSEEINRKGILFVITILALIPLVLPAIFEYSFWHTVSWSGYVVGSVLLSYICLILPLWFRRPNPVIFTPCGFAAATAFLWYVNWQTDGDWFLTFAFPILVFVALLVCTVITLLRYTRRGRLYIAGGTFIAVGVLCVVIEFFMNITFLDRMIFDFFWSIIPLIACFLAGMMLIIIAIARPLRESLKKRFFI